VDRCRLRSADYVQRNGLVSAAAHIPRYPRPFRNHLIRSQLRPLDEEVIAMRHGLDIFKDPWFWLVLLAAILPIAMIAAVMVLD
jgi:hypothetical protein